MLASQVYALSQGARCQGTYECHYCGAPCTTEKQHGEPIAWHLGRPLAPCTRARPGCPYVCVGCWLWRRKRVTAPYLSGGLTDGVSPGSRSWFVTDTSAWAVSRDCAGELYRRLLTPPDVFFLALTDGDPQQKNTLQCLVANTPRGGGRTAQTPLRVCINNTTFTYTVHELEQGAIHGVQGREAGVRELSRILGPVPRELIKHVPAQGPPEDKPRGRPKPQPAIDPRQSDANRPLAPAAGRPRRAG